MQIQGLVRARRLWVPLLLLALVISLPSCKRKPEDLEVWRPSVAKNGKPKLTEWVGSSEELMETRIRAAEILLEEDEGLSVYLGLKEASEADRNTIMAALVAKLGTWCKAADATISNYEQRKSKQVMGKEGSFHLYKFGDDSQRQVMEGCLVDWVNGGDFQIRDQMGAVKVLEIFELVGAKGAPGIFKAMENKLNSRAGLARELRKLKDPKIDKKLAEFLLEQAKAKKPEELNPNGDIETALLETDHDAVVPFLVGIVTNDKVDGTLRTTAVERIKEIKGKTALSIFLKWVKEQPDLLRWLAMQAIAEVTGKGGLTPMLNAMPNKNDYGGGDPKGFQQDAERFCVVEVRGDKGKDAKNKGMKDTESIFINQIKRGKTPQAKALSLQCLQHVGTQKARAPVEALAKDKTELQAWGDLKTLGALAQETLTKLPK